MYPAFPIRTELVACGPDAIGPILKAIQRHNLGDRDWVQQLPLALYDLGHPAHRALLAELDAKPHSLARTRLMAALQSGFSDYSRMAERLNEEKQKVLDQIRSLEEKNQQRQQAQQEIIQSEKLASVGRLAAGVAHEIGNPIGIILGYIQLLLTRQLDEQEKTDCLQRMNAETERVNSIIRNLLDYAQPSAEHREALDLNRIIEETHALVSYQKNYRNIEVGFDLKQKISPVMGDEKLLRQILVNLTFNALDAMPQGGTLAYKTALQQVADKTFVAAPRWSSRR